VCAAATTSEPVALREGAGYRLSAASLSRDAFYEASRLGDAANDLELLLAVDRPILMPRLDGSVDPALAARLRGSERAPFPGPAGWSAAVLAALAGEPLPRVGE